MRQTRPCEPSPPPQHPASRVGRGGPAGRHGRGARRPRAEADGSPHTGEVWRAGTAGSSRSRGRPSRGAARASDARAKRERRRGERVRHGVVRGGTTQGWSVTHRGSQGGGGVWDKIPPHHDATTASRPRRGWSRPDAARQGCRRPDAARRDETERLDEGVRAAGNAARDRRWGGERRNGKQSSVLNRGARTRQLFQLLRSLHFHLRVGEPPADCHVGDADVKPSLSRERLYIQYPIGGLSRQRRFARWVPVHTLALLLLLANCPRTSCCAFRALQSNEGRRCFVFRGAVHLMSAFVNVAGFERGALMWLWVSCCSNRDSFSEGASERHKKSQKS